MFLTDKCDRQALVGFITNQLDIDERLSFLLHVDGCSRCWDEIYNLRKAEHPHFYKNSSRQVKLSDTDLRRIDSVAHLDEEETEEAFEVA